MKRLFISLFLTLFSLTVFGWPHDGLKDRLESNTFSGENLLLVAIVVVTTAALYFIFFLKEKNKTKRKRYTTWQENLNLSEKS